jgi:hypothetical protein
MPDSVSGTNTAGCMCSASTGSLAARQRLQQLPH